MSSDVIKKQQPTSTSPRSPKNRYGTPLPWAVSYPEESLRRNRPKEISPSREVKQHVLPASPQPQYNVQVPQARRSFETVRSAGSNGGQAVVDTDAWLPYSRPSGVSDLDRMRAELELLEQQETPSTERSSPSTVRPATDSSKSSDPPNGSPNKLVEQSSPSASKWNLAEPQTWPLQNRTSPPQVPARNPHRMTLQSSKPQENTRRVRRQSHSPPQEGLQPRRTNDRNASQLQQPVPNYSRPWSPEFNLPKRPATSTSRARDLADTLSSLTARPAPRAKSRPPKPPSVHSVQYETVEGINLKTRPKSAKDNRNGLSIPEIEARDIRNIADRTPESFDDDMEYITRPRHYARSPPPIGAAPDYVRSISPRPVVDGEDHVFFDNYSRAADDELPDQRAEIPARYRRSIVAPFTKAMTPQPEEDEESLEGGAEPPEIARTRAFDAQDEEMNSRTHQAKSLISGMLKGFTGRRKDHSSDDNHGTNATVTRDLHALATSDANQGGPLDRTSHAHDGAQNRTSYLHDDSDEADITPYDNGIWSPNDMRRSVDTVIMRGNTPDPAAMR